MKLWIVGCLVVGLAACKKSDSDEHKDVPPAAIQVSSYADGIAQLEKHSAEISSLINQGKLADVHHEAAAIQKIANRLPDVASNMPSDMTTEIRTASQQLANMFAAIDDAADAGDKGKTIEAHEKMKTLIATLRRHAH